MSAHMQYHKLGYDRRQRSADSRARNNIPREKVSAFKTLFTELVNAHDGHNQACREISINRGTAHFLMNDNFCSERTARKILAAYHNRPSDRASLEGVTA